MWYHQAAVLAHEPSFVRNLGLPLQRSSNRNREFNAWSQGHKDNRFQPDHFMNWFFP